jgi:hypothetical protein
MYSDLERLQVSLLTIINMKGLGTKGLSNTGPDLSDIRSTILMEMHWSGTGYSVRYTRLSDI